MSEIAEAFNVLRQTVPAYAIELVDVLERRLTTAETLVRLHEQRLASGDAKGPVSPPNPEKADSPTDCAEANNIISIDPHRERYSWRVEGGAA